MINYYSSREIYGELLYHFVSYEEYKHSLLRQDNWKMFVSTKDIDLRSSHCS